MQTTVKRVACETECVLVAMLVDVDRRVPLEAEEEVAYAGA